MRVKAPTFTMPAPRSKVQATRPKLPFVAQLMKWSSSRIDVTPADGFWAFNPSILRLPDGRWLCSVRTANYHLDSEVGSTAVVHDLDPETKRPRITKQGRFMPGTVFNRNLMVELDPATWQTIAQHEIEERDELPRIPTRVRGYDDLRLTWTHRDGLCAIANVDHFKGGDREMCVVDFDDAFSIVRAQPLRGSWSEIAQKNWTPFVGTGDLRLVYSVERGGIHTRVGRILNPRPKGEDRESAGRIGGQPSVFAGAEQITLRGGSQLIQIPQLGAERWIGIAHGVSDLGEFGMHYWHTFYVCDRNGKLLAQTRPMKLSEARIEFAAGLAYQPDTDELVISFGVGDDTPMLGRVLATQVVRELDPPQGVQTPPSRELEKAR